MNIKLVLKLVGRVLLIEAAALAVPLAAALIYREDPLPFLLSIAIVAGIGFALSALPAKCPPELAAETDQVVSDVQMSYRAYRSSANMVRTTLELNLHQIEKLVAAAGGDPKDLDAGYAPPANAEPPRRMKTDFRA